MIDGMSTNFFVFLTSSDKFKKRNNSATLGKIKTFQLGQI